MDGIDIDLDVSLDCTGKCIKAVLTIASILGFAILVGLTINLKRPRCYIQGLYVPALDLSDTSNETRNNPCLFFDVKLDNVMDDHGVKYSDVNLTFSYVTSTRLPIGHYTVPEFYQGNGNHAFRREVLETRGLPWDEALKAVSNGSKVVFRVDLAAKPKFKFMFWYSRKKGLKVGANVEVDNSGNKVQKKDIRMKSSAHKHNEGVGLFVILGLLLSFLL